MTSVCNSLLKKAVQFLEEAGSREKQDNDRSFFIRNVRLADRDMDTPGAVYVSAGKISEIYTEGNTDLAGKACAAAEKEGIPVLDGQGLLLTPAFTDMHAHFREPGFPDKETVETGAAAAAAGGYTAAVLMANTNPVISTREAAGEINLKAAEKGLLQTFQAVSLTRGFDGKDTSHLDGASPQETPVASEDGRDVESPVVMLEAMKKCAAAGIIVSCHCEDPVLSVQANALRRRGDFKGAEKIFRLAEDTYTERNLLLAEEAGCRIHIAHVSTEKSLDSVRRAKARRNGLVTSEATPHHLCMNDGLEDAVNPPLRPEKDRKALTGGLRDGTIDVIATDHAPHTEEDKKNGAPGFSGIQTAFPLCYTRLVKTGEITLSKLSDLMAAKPASVLSIPRGLLKTGYDADLVLIDIDKPFKVDVNSPDWFSKGKNSPLDGQELYGKIMAVWKKGKQVFKTDGGERPGTEQEPK